MKARKILFGVSTFFVVAVMSASGLMAVAHAPAMVKALAHLGYPPYFGNLLGVAKLAGVLVLLLPGLPRLKEWAYVGFGITIISAAYSHLLSGDGWMAFEPLFFLGMLILSYQTRPVAGARSRA